MEIYWACWAMWFAAMADQCAFMSQPVEPVRRIYRRVPPHGWRVIEGGHGEKVQST